MKRFLMFFLAAAIAVSLVGCGYADGSPGGNITVDDGIRADDDVTAEDAVKADDNTTADIAENGGSDEHYWYLEGRYLAAKNGEHFILSSEQGPCRMMPEDDDVSFDGLTDGDMIKVKILILQETYPAQAPIYSIEKLSDGEYSDIDSGIIAELTDLGWLESVE